MILTGVIMISGLTGKAMIITMTTEMTMAMITVTIMMGTTMMMTMVMMIMMTKTTTTLIFNHMISLILLKEILIQEQLI